MVDVWGTITSTTYNAVGQVAAVTTTPPLGTGSSLAYSYNLDGQVTSVSDVSVTTSIATVLAQTTYDAAGRPIAVRYPSGSGNSGNGTSLYAATYDGAGNATGLQWQFAGEAAPVGDVSVRSQAGRILKTTISDSPTTNYDYLYSFDAVGRLRSASIPGHQLTYEFTPTNSCGTGTKAAANGNRTSMVDTPTGGGSLSYSTSYCYDPDDRLISTAETVAGAPSAPAQMLRASQSLPASSIVYDGHGNVIKLGDQSFTYDASDRHIGTVVRSGTAIVSTIAYVRDSTGAIVKRIETPAGGTPTETRYSAGLILSETGAVLKQSMALPGGVTLTRNADKSAGVWSYPNLHGDITYTANDSGARTGLFLYDPFGQPIDLATKVIGSAASNQLIPNNQPGSFDLGWVGAKGKGYEHAATIATIEMGVRMYSPMLGRFLAQDPVSGGNTSAYNYPNDPVNLFDLNGERVECGRGCSYDAAMAGTAVGNSSAARSIQNSGNTYDSGYNPVVSAAMAAQRFARSDAGRAAKTAASIVSFAAGFAAARMAQKKMPWQAIAATVIVSWAAGYVSTALGCAADPLTPDCAIGTLALLSPAGVSYGNGGKHALPFGAGRVAIGGLSGAEDVRFIMGDLLPMLFM